MIIDLVRLKNNIDEYIDIDYTYSFDKEQLASTELISLDNVLIKGFITKDSLDELVINLNISGTMVLPCSITLKPVDYEFETSVEGQLLAILAEIDEKNKKIENTIDILPIIWENILMEIPMKVVSPDAQDVKLEGDGWKFITEVEEKVEVNPELAKLKELLKKEVE